MSALLAKCKTLHSSQRADVNTHNCPAHKLYAVTLPHRVCRSLYIAKDYVCLTAHLHGLEDVDVENGTVGSEQAVQRTSHLFFRDLVV